MRVIDKITDCLVENSNSIEIDREILSHGIKVGFEFLLNVSTTIIVGIMLNLIFESIMFLIAFSFIRTYIGGFHCDKFETCFIFSTTLTTIILSLIKVINQSYYVKYSIMLLVIALPIIFKYAPCGTFKRTLDEKEYLYFKNKVRTNIVIECVVIIILLTFKLNSLVFLISICIFVCATMVLIQIFINKECENF